MKNATNRTLALALALTASLEAQTLIKDIETGPILGNPSSFPAGMTPAFGRAVFGMTTERTGDEVWITDGTRSGTIPLADVEPGYRSSVPRQFTLMPSGTLLFSAETGEFGREPWLLKPTGPELLLDILPGDISSTPYFFKPLGRKIPFIARNTGNRFDMWITDGTAAGTVALTDLATTQVASISGTVNLGSNAIFWTTTPSANAWDMWVTDGTKAGTRVVYTGTLGSTNRIPWEIASTDQHVLFRAFDPATGFEPWVTDGTAAGTHLLVDAMQGTASSFAYDRHQGYALGNRVLFFTKRGSFDDLWVSDGTTAGTQRIATGLLSAYLESTFLGELPGQRAVFSSTSYFTRQTLQNIFVTDGTTAGTALIHSMQSRDPATVPGVTLGNHLYFNGIGPEGSELWRTDGTPAGTGIVYDEPTGELEPRDIQVAGNRIVFRGDNRTNGSELWSTDGTSAGTQMLEFAPGPINGSSFPQLAGVFRGKSYWGVYDGGNPYVFWESDGTSAGTQRLNGTFGPSLSSSSEPAWIEFEDEFVFAGRDQQNGPQLWRSDGTSLGTIRITNINPGRGGNPRQLVRFGDGLCFTAYDDVHGEELWYTNRRTSWMLADIRPGRDSSRISGLTEWQGNLYFAAFSASQGYELFISDGTANGTRILADISPNGSSGMPSARPGPRFFPFGDHLYFAANEGQNGTELWRTDGTTAGTTFVRNLWPSFFTSSHPFGFVELNNQMVFAANTDNGVNLWASNGQAVGTRRLRTFRQGGITSALQKIDGSTAAFWVAENGNPSQLWVTDGTAAGTRLVATINATNVDWVDPTWHKLGESRLLFTANDGLRGEELWITDGTTAGTYLLVDIAPRGSKPQDLVRVGDRVVFSATDGSRGFELHAVSISGMGDYAVAEYGSGCAGTGNVVPTIGITGEVRASSSQPFAITLDDARSRSAAALLIGIGQTRLPLGGCSLWVDPLVALSLSTDSSGRASFGIAPNPAVAGAVINAQFVVLDPGGAGLNQYAASNGLEIVGGR